MIFIGLLTETMDLCIRCSEDVSSSLERLHTMGYTYCAVEHYVKALADLKMCPKIDYYASTATFNGPAEMLSEYQCADGKTPLHVSHQLSGRQLTILSRVTLDANCTQLQGRHSSPEIQAYDIIGVRVHTDDQIRQAVRLPIDVVQIAAGAKIRYSHSLLRELYDSGLTVELVLEDDVSGNVYHAFHLNRCIRNKPILLSSGGRVQPVLHTIEQCKKLYKLNTRHIWLAGRRVLSRSAARKHRNNFCNTRFS